MGEKMLNKKGKKGWKEEKEKEKERVENCFWF